MKRIIALFLVFAMLMAAVSAEAGIGVLIRRVRKAQYFGDTGMIKAFRTDEQVDPHTQWEVCVDYVSGKRHWKRIGVGPCLSVKLDHESVNNGYRCKLPDGSISSVYIFTGITERPDELDVAEEQTNETGEEEQQENAPEAQPGEVKPAEETTEQGTEKNAPAETEEAIPEVKEEEKTENLSTERGMEELVTEELITDQTEDVPETENAEDPEVEDETNETEAAEDEVSFEFESADELERLLEESRQADTELTEDTAIEAMSETGNVEPIEKTVADESEAVAEDTEENENEIGEEIEFIETPEDLNAMMIVPGGTSMLIKPEDGSDEVLLLEENTVVRVVALSTEWAMIEITEDDAVTCTGYVRKETIKLLPTKEPLPTPATWVESENLEKENDGVVYEDETLYLCVDASVYEKLVKIRWQCDYGVRGNWQDIPGAEGNRYPIVVTSKNVNYLFRAMLTIDD